MGLFKSKEERRLERTMEVKRALSQIKRQIKDTEKHELGYVQKAKRARKLGWANQYEFLKKAIKKSANVKVRLERQLLALESAFQIKEQTEGHAQFAGAMNALSKSISESFGVADLAKTQVNFEKAMSQAESPSRMKAAFMRALSPAIRMSEASAKAGMSARDPRTMAPSRSCAGSRRASDVRRAAGARQEPPRTHGPAARPTPA